MYANVNPQIFREYDIRGIVDKDLNEDILQCIGHAYGTYVTAKGKKKVVIAGDARLTTQGYKKAFVKGLMESGCHVTDVGICASPVLYFAIYHLKMEVGVMITASHNPSDYNGIKLNLGMQSVFGQEIQNVLKIIQEKKFTSNPSGAGYEEFVSINDIYIDFVTAGIKLSRPIKCIVDAGNGMGGQTLPKILRKLGCDVKEMFCEPDGSFPNHHPDPTIEENMTALINEMKTGKYEVGYGLDGDADRIGVIDNNGKLLYGDQILNILARAYLKVNPGQKVLGDVKCSKNLYDDIKKHGGIPVMYKTGHANIKTEMQRSGIKFGGEMSGHLFMGDRYLGYDDAIYACCRFSEVLADTTTKCADLLADQPKMYNTPEIRFETVEETKFKVVNDVLNSFKAEKQDVIDIDGMRITFPDGWGLIRASNTQPVLVMRFEANTPERRDEIQKLVENRLKQFS